MKINKYKIIRLAALIVFAAAFGIWGYTELIYLDADVTYKDLRSKVITASEAEPDSGSGSTQTEAQDTEPMLEIDHEKLLDVNRDYIFWLSACGDQVSYPVVRARTNEEYLHHTFFGDKSFVGSIFMDHRCSADLLGFHTILYGHSMKDRTMFRLIADYTSKSLADQYPYFYIYTPGSREKYEIFSVCDIDGDKLPVAVGTPTDEEKQAFIDRLKELSLYPLPAEPTINDNIISLITCDVRNDNKRIVVSAYRIE